jgi:hypothetical protein
MKKVTSQQIPIKFGESLGNTLKNLCSNKLKNQEEMDKFLYAYDLPTLTQEDINHLNRS